MACDVTFRHPVEVRLGFAFHKGRGPDEIHILERMPGEWSPHQVVSVVRFDTRHIPAVRQLLAMLEDLERAERAYVEADAAAPGIAKTNHVDDPPLPLSTHTGALAAE